MSKRVPSKESVHLKMKVALYESFLFGYLPQLTALSFLTRINLLDAFTLAGLTQPGTQGTPFAAYRAIHKQRQHQLKKQLPIKPFSLSLLSPPESSAANTALEALQTANQESNTCKLAHWPVSISEGIKQLGRQQQAQPASERNLLLLDPLGAPAAFVKEVRRLADKKTALIIPLPFAVLWQLHQKPDKEPGLDAYSQLKQILDSYFPADHGYWSVENTATDFANHLKEAFRMEGLFYTALEPAPAEELPPMVLLGLSPDAFMMEKMLQALQGLRSEGSPPAGAQLGLFLPSTNILSATPHPEEVALTLQLLKKETNNQELYAKALQAGYLPVQLQENLENLQEEGRIAVRNEKGKLLPEVPKGCVSFTAFKAAKPSCWFQLKG